MVDYTMLGNSARANIRKYLGVPADTPIKRATEALTVPVKKKHVAKGKACDAKLCMFSLAIHDATESPKHAVFRTITWAYMRNPKTGVWTLYYWQTPQQARELLGKNDAGLKSEIKPPFFVAFPALPPARDLVHRRKHNKAYRERVKSGVQVVKRRKFKDGRVSVVVGGKSAAKNKVAGAAKSKVADRAAGKHGGHGADLLMPIRPVAPRSFGVTA